jgi:hypothetical protein
LIQYAFQVYYKACGRVWMNNNESEWGYTYLYLVSHWDIHVNWCLCDCNSRLNGICTKIPSESFLPLYIYIFRIKILRIGTWNRQLYYQQAHSWKYGVLLPFKINI